MEENETTEQSSEASGINDTPVSNEENIEADAKPENNEPSELVKPVDEIAAPIIPPRRNKAIILTVLIAMIVLAIVATLVWLYLYPNNKVSLYNAEVSLVSGQVEKSEKSGTWLELKNGDNVSQGDLVRVNGEGRAVITLDDGSAVRLDSSSRVELVSLDPKNIEIDNEAGEVYTRVVKADRPFVVKIGDESYKAMGTAYKTVNDASEKGVYVYESKVQVVAEDKEISEGEKYLTQYDADGSLIRKILEISSDEITVDTFLQWNKTQDLKSTEFKKYMGVLQVETTTAETKTTQTESTQTENTQVQQTTPVVEASIALSGSASSDAINLSWNATGVDTSHGFKVIKGTSANPVYPGNSAVYIKSGGSYSWKITDGVTYNFRVCQYTGSGCGVYSNNIQITAPHVEDGAVNSINLAAGEGSNVSWTVDGYSDLGFKLVWSKVSSPTYPNRGSDRYHYYSSSGTTSGSIEAFGGSGTYYVRVCEYLGGTCGVYSNEITVELSSGR